MRINEIINESHGDLVARYYDMNRGDYAPNPEADQFADMAKDYYRKHFGNFFDTGEIFVFDKCDGHDKEPPMTTKPEEGNRYSAGYRGKQLALKHAGHKYDKERTAL